MKSKAVFCIVLVLASCVLASDSDSKPWRLLSDGQITWQTTHPEGGTPPNNRFDEGFYFSAVGWEPASLTVKLDISEHAVDMWVAVGLMEPFWNQIGKRIQTIEVEGAEPMEVDIVEASGGINKPFAVVLPAKDIDGNNKIKVTVRPSDRSADKNVVLSKVWLFTGEKPDPVLIKKGQLNERAKVMTRLADLQFKKTEVIDGKLVFGNGYFLGCFVGPMEMPENPVIEVHDKISRLWMGYSSPQSNQVGLGVTIVKTGTGEQWTVKGCDEYRFEDGVIHMETQLPIGVVRTETFGLWAEPVLVRRIKFVPNEGLEGDYQIQTQMQLYQDYDNTPPTDIEGLRVFKQAYPDTREIPPSLLFPEVEIVEKRNNDRSVRWTYDNPYYRKAVVGVFEKDARLQMGRNAEFGAATQLSVRDTDYGAVRMSSKASGAELELTVVMSYGSTVEQAEALWDKQSQGSLESASTRKQWVDWFNGGAVVKTGNAGLDMAYRNQMMYYRISQDAELGGMVNGGRYQVTTVWVRDANVGISALLDAGHYAEARFGLEFFAKRVAWNMRNNCLHPNYHSSGRVAHFVCDPAQQAVEEVIYPFERNPSHPPEWHMQMAGPQLDGMAYWLYNIGKYERYTGDMEFVKSVWPFLMQVAHALAADQFIFAEVNPENGFFDSYRYYSKYSPQTGLIIDMCYEDWGFREHALMNGMAVLAFNEAYRLSEKMGEGIQVWKKRSEQLDQAFQKHLIKQDEQGRKYYLEWVTRDWLADGKEIVLGKRGSGYAMTIASVVPYLNWRNPVFIETFEYVPADGNVQGWGMWFATLAHAAFEADRAEVGWNYLSKLASQLAPSKLIYEHNSLVSDSKGNTKNATLDLYCYAYLPHAMIRGFAGIGFDEHRREYFFRPQIPSALDRVESKVRIGTTTFEVVAEGSGSRVSKFIVDGEDLTSSGGILEDCFIDGKHHNLVIIMTK